MTDSISLQDFREVTAVRNGRFGTKLKHVLDWVTHHPSHALRIGIVEVTPDTILVNSMIFASFLRLKLNTVNRCFARAGYYRTPMMAAPGLGVPAKLPGWSLRTRIGITVNESCGTKQAQSSAL
jgi:hypothetical protein